MAFLGERGVASSLLDRMRERLATLATSRRLRILLGLAVLLSSVEDLLDALDDEVARLVGGDGEASPDEDFGARRALTA